MKEVKILEDLLNDGLSKKYLCKVLSLTYPTLKKRLKDGKFKQIEKDKIKSLFK